MTATTGGTPRRNRGRPRNQARVIEATLDLLDEQGVRGVTMEAIADRAGISKVTLYRNWSNRATVMAEALLKRIESALPLDASADPLAAIEDHATRFARALNGRTGELLRDIISDFVGHAAMMRDFREHYLGHRRLLATDLIERGLRTGRFAATGRAQDLHDALYGAIFYRFLFRLGSLTKPSVAALIDTILIPRR